MDDESPTFDCARNADARCRRAAGSRRLRRCADHRFGGGGDPGVGIRAGHSDHACAGAGRRGRGARRTACRRATRHFPLPVVAARAARPARECPDPREGADARACALRGLRVLRQADARPSRGFQPPAIARNADLRPRAERSLPRKLRHPPRPVLALGRRHPDRSRAARLRGRDPVFRRGVSPLSLALA